MTLESIQVGAFDLQSQLAQGGMGTIWRGEHRAQKVPVAVKVLSKMRDNREDDFRAFYAEVRATARLNHPGIVTVYDYGRITPQAALQSEGRLQEGTPYLVMEYASGGSLDLYNPPSSWNDLRRILFAMLDALAHAHAKGVTHRDLKPGNILICTEDDPRPGLKLTDFGIAHAGGFALSEDVLTSATEELPSGTPYYMAPEQFQGRWRDYGPWTDLYSLGMVTYELVTGFMPFDGDSFLNLGLMHLKATMPALEPLFEVPSGFEDWLLKLSAKKPAMRFQRAVDAAWALRQLSPPEEDDEPFIRLAVADSSSLLQARQSSKALTYTHQMDYMATVPEHSAPIRETSSTLPAIPHSGALPTLPKRSVTPALPVGSWRRLEDVERELMPTAPLLLAGAGLGLHGLREVDMVGRVHERDTLWEALRKVHSERTARAVILQGPDGVGKSRLVRWFSERAHEMGLASILKARHGPTPNPAYGVPRMLSNHLGCTGMRDARLVQRLERVLTGLGCEDPYMWNTLGRMLKTWGEAHENVARRTGHFVSPIERFRVKLRLLDLLGAERPLIVWLDDVHFTQASIDFVLYALQQRKTDPVPVLFVLVASPQDDGVESPLQPVADLECVVDLQLAPLRIRDCQEVIQSTLSLESDLALDIAQAAQGNPLLALQIVNFWVESDALNSTPHGFVLQPGRDAYIPTSLDEIWVQKFAHYMSSYGEDNRVAFEAAAALGKEVDHDELSAVCEKLDVTLSQPLLNQMLDAGVLSSRESGWAFAYNRLRGLLQDSAKTHGRTRVIHQHCAEVLEELHSDREAGIAERRARHFVSAGQPYEAIACFLQAVDESIAACNLAHADALLDERDQILMRASVDTSDEEWLLGQLRRAQIQAQRWRFKDTRELLERILQVASRSAQLDLIAAIKTELAETHTILGQHASAWSLHKDALAFFEWKQDERNIVESLESMAHSMLCQGDHEKSDILYSKALERAKPLNDPLLQAHGVLGLAEGAYIRQEFDVARGYYEDARAQFQSLGALDYEAFCFLGFGHIERAQRQYKVSTQWFLQAQSHWSSVGSKNQVFAELALGFAHVLREEYKQALPIAYACMNAIRGTGYRLLQVRILALFTPCLAAQNRWDEFHATTKRLVRLVRETNVAHPHIALCLQESAKICIHKVRIQDASQALRLALAQWLVLGVPGRIADVQDKVDALEKSTEFSS